MLGIRKLVPGLSGLVCVILCLSFWCSAGKWQTDRQTDGWTDGQTHDDSIYRATIASLGKMKLFGSCKEDVVNFKVDTN